MPSRIEQWKIKKSECFESHKKLAIKLKRVNEKKLNQLADDVHEQIFEQLDCLDCANCCKTIPPIINETDIRRVAKHLGMKVTSFKELYVKYDEDMDLVMKCSPCPFLQSDNKCEIYEFRPKACREYPHTGDFDFSKNLKLHPINSKYCPAVFHILEEISAKLI
jgi:uncharacterized protein